MEGEEADVCPSGGGSRFWLGVSLPVMVLHWAGEVALLPRLVSGDGWPSCTRRGQCGVGRVDGEEAVPMDAIDEGVS